MLRVVSPTVCRIENIPEYKLTPTLSYTDKKVDHEIARLRRSLGYSYTNAEKVQAEIEVLKTQRKKSLLFKDEQGLWTYAGLASKLASICNSEIANEVSYPEPQNCSWSTEPEFKLRPYQREAVDKLLAAKHAGIEKGTGLGKSLDILFLAKELGLKTLVMAPSISIANQLYQTFLDHLGKKRVGKFFESKKESGKQFVIAVAASLARVVEDSEAYKDFGLTQVFIADESHMTPAETLRQVCLKLVANAPYRFFFSGTQTRTDGQEIVLDGITGPIVYRMSVMDGVDQGYLAKPVFRIIPIESNVKYYSQDVDRMTNRHLRYNPQVLAIAGSIANRCVKVMNRQTVILVDEIEQFTKLLPFLKVPAKFAHGTLNKEQRKLLPEAYWDSDPHGLVKEFNQGNLPVLVGTSCISIGTDIKTVGAIIYLVGGMSEIAVKQAVGRGTRGGRNSSVLKNDGIWCWGDYKEDCLYFDFEVRLPSDNDPASSKLSSVARHSQERINIYNSIYPSLKEVPWQ